MILIVAVGRGGELTLVEALLSPAAFLPHLIFTSAIFIFQFLCRTILDITFLPPVFLDILTPSNFSTSLCHPYHCYFYHRYSLQYLTFP